jgi:signal transduction histidine kinase
VDLAETVSDAVSAVAQKSAAAAIPVRVATSLPSIICQTHSERLSRVLVILLSNAIKHSNAGGEVTVGLERMDGAARISVGNTGSPIPDALRNYIFEPFVLGEDTDIRRKQGSGLGLAIAQNLTASIGGRIDFTSDEAETRFWLDIPATAGTTGFGHGTSA